MDIAKAFTFVGEDDEWLVKMGIGAVISLFSFLFFPAFLLAGYMVAVTRNVQNGLKQPLPEWDDWGRLFKDGLFVAIGQFVYTLPVWLLSCVGVAATVGFSELDQFSADAATAIVGTTWAVLGCLMAIVLIAIFFISPAVIIQYVRYEEFGAVFRVGEVLAIARDNVGKIIMAVVASFVASLVLSVGIAALNIIPCLGAIAGVLIGILAGPWLVAAIGHMYGQIAAGGKTKASAPF